MFSSPSRPPVAFSRLRALQRFAVSAVAALAVLAALPSAGVARPSVVPDTSGARGFQPWSSSILYSQRASYTIRLTAAADGTNVEPLRSHFEAAAARIMANNGGPFLTVAPGVANVGSAGVADGEIWISVGNETCPGHPNSAGCGGPNFDAANPVGPNLLNGTYPIKTGFVSLKSFTLGYSSEGLSHLVTHELGHALGLAHHDPDHQGETQTMHSSSYAAPTFRSGDLNGLQYQFDADNDGTSNEIDACPVIAGAIGSSGCPQGNPSTLTSDGTVHTAFVNYNNELSVYKRLAGGGDAVRTGIWGAASNSVPSSVTTANGQIQTAFVDYDQQLRFFRWTPGGAEKVTEAKGAVKTGTSPFSVVTYDGMVHTAWVTPSGLVNIYRWTPTANSTLTGVVATKGTSSPTMVINRIGQIELAYHGVNGKLRFYRINDGASTGSDAGPGTVSLGANTSPHAVTSHDGSVQIAYFGSDGTLHTQTRTLANINAGVDGTNSGQIYGYLPGSTSPQSVVAQSGEISTAFHANDGAMHIYRWGPASGGPVMSGPIQGVTLGTTWGSLANSSPASIINAAGKVDTMFMTSDYCLRLFEYTPSSGATFTSDQLWGARSI